MNAYGMKLRDLAELEHYTNLKEVNLRWLHGPVTEALAMLEHLWIQRCTHLRRLTLAKWEESSLPSSEELCDFIMELKDLTFLHIIYRHVPYYGHFTSLVFKVKAFVLPRRPNFEFVLRIH